MVDTVPVLPVYGKSIINEKLYNAILVCIVLSYRAEGFAFIMSWTRVDDLEFMFTNEMNLQLIAFHPLAWRTQNNTDTIDRACLFRSNTVLLSVDPPEAIISLNSMEIIFIKSYHLKLSYQ